MSATRHELAALIGVDVRTIKNLVDDGMPKLARGKYDLGVCVKWYIERSVELARAGKGLNDLDLARQRKTVAEARMAELELEQLEGNLIPLDLHEQRVEGLSARLASQCKGLDRFIAGVQRATSAVDAKAVVDDISDTLLAALRAVADDLETESVLVEADGERSA